MPSDPSPAATPQATTPQATTPQATTPQATTPQATTPQANPRRAGTGRGELVVVTATAPTPNGPLHLGHLSGPYVAADIAARAARARGEHVLTVSGLDPHQNYVLAKAQKEGRKADAVLDDYEALVCQAFAAARVGYDLFADPRADDGYRTAVRGLLDELVDRRAVVLQRETLWRCADCGATLHHAYVTGRCPGCGSGSGGGTCEGCGGFTTGANLAGARCACCGGPREPMTARVPVLRLEDYRGELTDIWSCAVLPPRVRRLIAGYLADGLPDVPLAYPTDWGIAAATDGQRIDVWAEMGLGLLSGLPRHRDPAAGSLDDYLAGWRQPVSCWHFLGMDNVFYFAVLFPALFAAAGVPAGWLGGLIVNEFYRLDGLKFSTSRDHAVWAHEFLADEDPALLRLFLCWDRPDRDESSFTRQAYAAFCDWAAPALFGADGGGTLPAELVDAELSRAGQALRFDSFDPPLALRCLIAAGAGRAPRLLAALTGEPRAGEPRAGEPRAGEPRAGESAT
jgi:methionyl-tRNA synthetase